MMSIRSLLRSQPKRNLRLPSGDVYGQASFRYAKMKVAAEYWLPDTRFEFNPPKVSDSAPYRVFRELDMLSLYHALLAQHPRQLTPVRCAEQTISQLHHYFEDVVLENNLSALVVEGLLPQEQRTLRDISRIREVGKAGRYSFFFVSPDDALKNFSLTRPGQENPPVMLVKASSAPFDERFVVIADARFSGLLAALRPHSTLQDAVDSYDVIWTFEPDIVYSALEYLMARVTAEYSPQSSDFSKAVSESMPKTTSLQLTVSVTTKLARLLQEQAGRELAVNRIAKAIRSSLNLPSVLQTTVDELARALSASHGALSVTGDRGQPSLTTFYSRDGNDDDAFRAEMVSDLDAYAVRLRGDVKAHVQDGTSGTDSAVRPYVVLPIIYGDRTIGALMVCSDDPGRAWQESELLLMRTVVDQVAVAVEHARLFQETQQQAMTDSLTGCVNRRAFEMQLERDLHLGSRMRQSVSLVLVDIDHFKRVNDTFGHDAGDTVLRHIADALQSELRGVDTAARFGGEEFAVILPQATLDGAMIVAERLRARVEKTVVPGIGTVTASFGIATFPGHAGSRDRLVTLADRALYLAKRSGRNRVCCPSDLEGKANVDLERQEQDDDLISFGQSRPEVNSVQDENEILDLSINSARDD